MSITAEQQPHGISIWIKFLSTFFLCILVPVYWTKLGPANFLWVSQIALITINVALWLENRFLASMMATGVLLPELLWCMDFFTRLLAGKHLFGLGATSYMFSAKIPWIIRILSFLYHVYLPTILIFVLYRLGYHRKAWLAQTVLLWVVLPLCYWLTDPQANINWVFGLGAEPQQWLSGPVYLVLLMIMFPLIVCIPSHLMLNRLFGKSDLEAKT